jgi:hypothetical protein
MRKFLAVFLISLFPTLALAAGPGYGTLQTQNALSELRGNAATARTNLGLGSAATAALGAPGGAAALDGNGNLQAPTPSVRGGVTSVTGSNVVVTGIPTNGTPTTAPFIGTTAGTARDAAAAIAAETNAQNTANAAVPSSAVGVTVAPLASPTFTGTPTAPTGTAGSSTTQISTQSYANTAAANAASGATATAVQKSQNGADFASPSTTLTNLGGVTAAGAATSAWSGAGFGFGSAPSAASVAASLVGTTSGTLAAGNDSRITGAAQTSGSNTFSGANTFGTVNYNSSNVTTAPIRWNISGSLINGGTIGAVQKITNTGGLNNVGITSDYYSASLSPGFDNGYVWYAYADPTPLASPITFSASISGTTMTLTAAASAPIPIGVILSGSGISSNTIIRALTGGTNGAIGATYTVSISQTVSSEAMSAINGHPAYYNNFAAMICPNSTVLTYGCAVAEWDVVNRGADSGFMRFRGDANNPTGGLIVVPEVTNFSDPAGTGGLGTNATYGYVIAHSGGVGQSGYQAAFYSGLLIEPNSIVGGTGRGLYETGDITSTSARVPYSPIDWDGTWAHGLMAAYATIGDNAAVTVAPGQGIVNIVGSTRAVDQPPTTPTATAGIYATGSGTSAGWNITTAGAGAVTVNGSPIPASVSSEIDTFTANGTWTKNSSASFISCIVVGAGSGGGAGVGPTTNGTVYSGGAGGSAGYVLNISGPASAFPSAAAVVIGTGGSGGTTSGQAGSSGGSSSFNGRTAFGGGGSAGGQTAALSASGQAGDPYAVGGSATASAVVTNNYVGTAGSTGTGISTASYGSGSSGAAGLASGAARNGGIATWGPAGGGSGGGMPATPALQTGGNGGGSASLPFTNSGSTAGAAGSNGINTVMGFGTGGGGGANNISGTGGAGGIGGIGAGGGGGGDGTTAPGAGGSGGNGLVQCIQSP